MCRSLSCAGAKKVHHQIQEPHSCHGKNIVQKEGKEKQPWEDVGNSTVGYKEWSTIL